jgi:hypothetical protein
MPQKVDPLVPFDVDLRDFPYMPLDVVRLRDSDLATTAPAEAFQAAVMLWCASWHQIPASSLPSDDRLLAKLAGYGRDVPGWQRIKQDALRGFVLCSDDRYYHPVIADKAIEAVAKKKKQSDRTANATAARLRKEAERNVTRNEERNVADGADVTLSKGKEGIGIEGKGLIPPVVPPDGGTQPEQAAKPEQGKRRKRSERINGTRLSPDWKPTAEDRDYARGKGLSEKAIDAQAEKFRNHWVSSTGRNAVKLDWPRTWQNWILSSIERNPALVTEAVTIGAGAGVSQELKERAWAIFLERERDGKALPNNLRKEDIPKDFIDRWNAENGGLFDRPGGAHAR